MSAAVNVAVVGATGAVWQEFINVLAERNFPIRSIKFLASARSAGKPIDFNGKTYGVPMGRVGRRDALTSQGSFFTSVSMRSGSGSWPRS